MKTVLIFVACLSWGQCLAQERLELLNRIVSTGYDTSAGIGKVIFTDTDSGEVFKYDLPPGFLPGYLVAMDHRGDVWVDDFNSLTLRKLSAVDGSVLATINPPRRATYLVTARGGTLIIASRNTLLGPQASVYIDRYTADGAYIDGVDIKTLFPPGIFAPAMLLGAAPTAPQKAFAPITRVLVTRSGALWLGVPDCAYNPVVRLTPDLQLAGSYGLYGAWALVPDDDEGVWVFHRSGGIASQYFLNAPPMPGLPLEGWVHLSATGQVLDFNNDGIAIGLGIVPSHGHRRYDGRQFQYATPGINTPNHVRVSNPGNPPFPWFPWEDRIDFTAFHAPLGYIPGFHLDGAQRLWVQQCGNPITPPNWPLARWMRFPVEPPYTDPLLVDLGEQSRTNVYLTHTGYWSSYWGHATLFEYVHYTDPYSDLDRDGVPNNVELANFSNPLVPYGSSTAATATGSGGAPGTTFTVQYSVINDKDLAYAAPFSLVVPPPQPMGGGHFLPVSLTDPLVTHCLTPGAAGVTGTIGVLSPQGTATATLTIPALPALSGMALRSCIVTHDPNLPLPLKTVSRLFKFQIP